MVEESKVEPEKTVAVPKAPVSEWGPMTEPKLFGKWSYADLKVKDPSLDGYMGFQQVRTQVYIPHTAGKYQTRGFRKVSCPIIERMVDSMMMHGRNAGKKLMATKIVKQALEIIHLMSPEKENPLQVVLQAIENGGAREDSTRIQVGGVIKRQAVDVAPLRRVNQSIYLMCLGAREASFRKIKSIAECLAEEIMNCAKVPFILIH